MELIPILTRAESLFRRFERTVQTIDKKNNFPSPPGARQRISSSSPDDAAGKGKSPQRATFSSGSSIGQHVARGVGAGAGAQADKEKVISPELRQLLRREVLTLNSKQIQEHGGGNKNSKTSGNTNRNSSGSGSGKGEENVN
jgi:hypothetical protein